MIHVYIKNLNAEIQIRCLSLTLLKALCVTVTASLSFLHMIENSTLEPDESKRNHLEFQPPHWIR